MKDFIDAILQADQQAPRKQRHTAQRIWQRIRQERTDARVSSSTVRRPCAAATGGVGAGGARDLRPAGLCLGSEAQVDWYDAVAEIGGERQQVRNFSMLSMASGDAFHVAYYHATQQAFLEAHEVAFRHFVSGD